MYLKMFTFNINDKKHCSYCARNGIVRSKILQVSLKSGDPQRGIFLRTLVTVFICLSGIYTYAMLKNAEDFIDWCFTPCSRIFYLCNRTTIMIGENLSNHHHQVAGRPPDIQLERRPI